MTTITVSEYSPDSPAQPLTPLKTGQVALLNKGAAKDISQKVKTVVQRHLGYQGTEHFRTTFTKNEITFALKNGTEAENRTLKVENGRWMLSQNNATSTPLNPNLEDEVNAYVTEILANIGQASRTNVSDPAPINSAAAMETVHTTVNADELVQIKDRLTTLENQLRTNLTLEQSLEVQRQILEQLVGLKTALEKHPPTDHAERDKLQKALAEKEKEFQDFIRDAKAQFERMQKEFEDEKKEFQKALEAKNRQTVELQQNKDQLQREVKDLQKTLKNKGAELQNFISEAKAEYERMQERFGKEKEKFEEALESQQKIADLEKAKNLKTIESVKAEKALLEEQLNTASSNLEITTEQLETLQTQNVDLDSKLQQAEFLGQMLEQTVQGLQKLLKEKEQQLEAAAQKAQESESKILNELEKVKAALEKTEKDRLNLATAYAESNIRSSATFAQKNDELKRTRIEAETAVQKAQESELQTLNELKKVKEAFLETQDKVEKLQTIFDKKETQALEAFKLLNDEKERSAEQWHNEALLLQTSVNYYKDHAARLSKKLDYQDILVDEVPVLEKRLTTAQSDLDIKTQQLENLETQLQRLQGAAENLRLENNRLTDETTAAEQVIILDKEQIASLSEQLETATQMQEMFQEKIKILKSDLGDAKKIAAEALDACKKATENESEIDEEFRDYQEQMEIFIEQQNIDLSATKSANEELLSELESQKKLNEFSIACTNHFENSLTEKDQQLVAAAENLSQMKSQLEQANQTQETLQAQNTDLSSKLKSAETAGEVSTLTIQELQASLKKKESQLEDARSDLELAQTDTEEAKLEAAFALQKVNKTLQETQHKINNLEGELSQLTTAYAQAQLELKDFEQNALKAKEQQVWNRGWPLG